MGIYGSLNNKFMSESFSPVPEVGMGATELLYTDRKAYTIIEVNRDGKEIVLQRDKATRTNGNGMSDIQTYDFTQDEKGEKRTVTLRKNGKWVTRGDSLRSGVGVFLLGIRKEYYDFSF